MSYEPPIHDPRHDEDFYREQAEGDCPASVCSAFSIGQAVLYKGETRTVYDVDEGYGMLALDGDKYICPNHPDNRCVEAPMGDCEILSQNR